MNKKRGRPKGTTMPTPTERKCLSCKTIYSISNFHKSKGHSGGYTYVCKTCNTIIAHTKYIKDRYKKYGYKSILNEIEELKAGIQLRWAILYENLKGKIDKKKL